MKYLLIGSGHSAKNVKNWTIKNHFVAVINNSWKIYPEYHIAFYAGDLPIEDRPDTHAQLSKNQIFVSDQISPSRNQYTWNICRQELNRHKETTLTMTLVWFLWHSAKIKKKIEKIGLIGCDLNYTPDENGHTHFYGVGNDIMERNIPDPFLKHTKDELIMNLINIQRWGESLGTQIVNYSDDPESLLPFPKETFTDD